MIEKEAHQKLCPIMTRTLGSEPGPVYCQGSDCIAWDWFSTCYERIKDGIKFSSPPMGSDPDEYKELPRQGDCGMKPPPLECSGGF